MHTITFYLVLRSPLAQYHNLLTTRFQHFRHDKLVVKIQSSIQLKAFPLISPLSGAALPLFSLQRSRAQNVIGTMYPKVYRRTQSEKNLSNEPKLNFKIKYGALCTNSTQSADFFFPCNPKCRICTNLCVQGVPSVSYIQHVYVPCTIQTK